MPDAFGLETPKEAQERVAELFRQQRIDFSSSALAQTTGGRAGQALGQIFGGSIKKFLDTRSARKSEAARLVEETGVSAQEARKLAKSNVAPDFREVRRSKSIEKASLSAQEVVERLTPEVGPVLAQASGMLVMAAELRKLGFASEATSMTQQAIKIRQDEELRIAELDSLRTGTKNIGTRPIENLQGGREEIEAKIDASDDPQEIVKLERSLDEINKAIEKNLFITGSTETDLQIAGLTKPTITSLQESLIESGNQLDLLTSIGDTFQPEFLTFIGKGKAALFAIAEKAGVTLGKGGKQFLAEFSSFKRNALDGLNRYIKLITGAQMSEAEADRLRKAFPDVEKDSPTQFTSKYVEVVRQIMAVRRRAQASLAGNLSLLPSDFKEGLGANLDEFLPTREEAINLVGLQSAFDAPVSQLSSGAGIQVQLPGGGTATIGTPIPSE